MSLPPPKECSPRSEGTFFSLRSWILLALGSVLCSSIRRSSVPPRSAPQLPLVELTPIPPPPPRAPPSDSHRTLPSSAHTVRSPIIGNAQRLANPVQRPCILHQGRGFVDEVLRCWREKGQVRWRVASCSDQARDVIEFALMRRSG